MGLNHNLSSRSGTSYHVQIEDRGPIFDDASEGWVRRVNVIAYANYGEPSAHIASRVARAREAQLVRQGKPNALLGTRDIDRHCATGREGGELLRHALARLLLSPRAYHRVLRVARSIADLAGASTVGAEHVAEAIQYRRLDASF